MSIKKRVENKNHDLVFWLLALSTLVLGIVVIGNLSKKPVQVVNSDSQATAQVASLQAEIARLNSQVNSATNEEQAKQPDVDSSIRGMSTQTGPCPIENYLTYIESRSKIQLRLPFSAALEDGQCVYFPPEFLPDGIQFGEYNAIGGEIHHDALLTIGTNSISLTEFKQAIDSERADPSIRISNFKERNVNGLTVISFTRNADGGPDDIQWVAYGKSYTYTLHTKSGWLTDAEAIKIIESLKITK